MRNDKEILYCCGGCVVGCFCSVWGFRGSRDYAVQQFFHRRARGLGSRRRQGKLHRHFPRAGQIGGASSTEAAVSECTATVPALLPMVFAPLRGWNCKPRHITNAPARMISKRRRFSRIARAPGTSRKPPLRTTVPRPREVLCRPFCVTGTRRFSPTRPRQNCW